MKNVLICLEQLNIGGIETFTITQVKALSRKKINCYILAKDGILKEKISNNKYIHFLEFDFKLENNINFNKVKEIENIIISKKIDSIIIHQFPCIPYLLPVIFKLKIPYFAYLHSVVPKTCEWFMKTYDIYNVLFPLYFKNASKIIAITKSVQEENSHLFNIPKEKYIILNNSLDFTEYKKKEKIILKYPFTNFLLISRLSKEKEVSINTAISFFKRYKEKYNSSAKLTIAGNGDIYNKLESKYSNDSIIFIGAVKDAAKVMNEADVVLGVDRCILESIASQKPSIICSYKGNLIFVTPKNIKDATKENFTGNNIEENINELFSTSEKKLKEIINDNYNFIVKNLNIDDHILTTIEPFKLEDDLYSVFNNLNYYSDKIKKLEEENKKLYLRNQDCYKKINELEKKINGQNKHLSIIYRLVRKIKNRGGKSNGL